MQNARPSRRKWKRGEKAAFSRISGIMPHHLSEILSGKRKVSFARAKHLEKCSAEVLSTGKIHWVTWMEMSLTCK